MLRAYPRCNQKTAIQFLDYLLARLPFRVEVIQTDNGGEFGTQFHYHVLDRGIRHVYIKPATPRLNGKVERSHRIDEEEFYRMLDGVVIDDTNLFNDKLQEWEDFYNFNRPHGGLDGQTPYERLRQKRTVRSRTVRNSVRSRVSATVWPNPECRKPLRCKGFRWWRGRDLNPRPSGYEPDELPDCSTPRCVPPLYQPCTDCGIGWRR